MYSKSDKPHHIKRFTIEIEKIDQNINNIKKMTAEAIDSLEEKKRKLRQSNDPNAVYHEGVEEIEKEIQEITFEKDELLGQMIEKQEAVKIQKLSIDKLEQIITDMDKEISHVQAQHDQALLELEQKKASLCRRLSSIEKLDLLVNVLTHKIFETQHNYRTDMDELRRQKENLIKQTNLTETQRALQLAELDKKVADRKNIHESTLASLEGQRTELRRESALKIQHLDTTMETLKTQHEIMLEELEAQKVGATPSQIEEINRQIAELNRMFEKDTDNFRKLQEQGWKDLKSDEKLSAMLESRGLRVTVSGHFLTASGRLLSRSEAECMGLLKGINIMSWDNLLQNEVDLGLTPTSDSSITEATTTASIQSKMSAEDVHYLKTVLGKPLTLALAEIVSVQPRDPIHYLGHWLFKYRYNQEVDLNKKQEIQELIEERDRLEKAALHAMMQDEARAVVLDMIVRTEEKAIRRELERIARETAMLENEEEATYNDLAIVVQQQ